MWLPKDERETLLFYYHQFAVGKIPLQTKNPWDEGIHFRLGNRGLISITAVPSALLITLTPEGIRLGQIYNSWWSRSNLWYEEHLKSHWIWVIIGFLGGVISTLLINWLSIYLQKTPSAK
jgi:hypothetical protein